MIVQQTKKQIKKSLISLFIEEIALKTHKQKLNEKEFNKLITEFKKTAMKKLVSSTSDLWKLVIDSFISNHLKSLIAHN